MSRAIFNNPNHQADFEKNGFVIVPLFNEKQVNRLQEIYFSLPQVFNHGFNATLNSDSNEYKKLVREGIESIFNETGFSELNKYTSFAANFLSKHPGNDSELPLHQDFSFTDESKYWSLNIWSPLTDVNQYNGAVSVIRGSHKWDNFIRASPITPSPYTNIVDFLKTKLEILPMKAGQAIIHSHKLLHYSVSNSTDKVRLAVCIGMIPQEAPLMHYYLTNDKRMLSFKVSGDFFTRFKVGLYPEGETLVNETNLLTHFFTEEEVKTLLQPAY